MVNLYEHAEYTAMIEIYVELNNNANAASEEYYQRFGVKPLPKTVLGAVRRFRENEAIVPKLGGPRDRTVLTWQKEDEILDYFHENPNAGTRSVAEILGVNKKSLLSVLHGENMHDYHYTRVQGLQPTDYIKREEFCQTFIAKNNEHDYFLNRILWSDECTFTREGMFNSHNYHLWAEENPHATRQAKFQTRWNINVWAGLLDDRLVSFNYEACVVLF